MDDVAEQEEAERAARRSRAFRESQKSTSNIFRFRRLKWQLPGRTAEATRGFSIVNLLLVIIILALLGFSATYIPAIRQLF
jgi:hypothetical protein